MRTVLSLNEGWLFSKSAPSAIGTLPEGGETVNLPHSWNGADGADGGNDYHRGTCYYCRAIEVEATDDGRRHFLEINGANSSADVYVGGEKLCHHDGGYSTFRVDITDALKLSRLVTVAVDNSPCDSVYPQMADFTFYGGLYRNVNLISVPQAHFDLEYYGAPGIQITPIVEGENAKVTTKLYTVGADGATYRYTITDKEGAVVTSLESDKSEETLTIEGVTLWQGRKNPYLYKATAEMLIDGEVMDTVSARFGCRSFSVDPERGFILNGEEYPLRGVSRHQDRPLIGNALLPLHHREDIELILEVGATTVRLAHYQHDQYFYDLCDEAGLVIWAEIPYISKHMPNGRENTRTQMIELICQNYNHPSIVVWGLSNEITMNGDRDPDLLDNHRMLNDLCHAMDKTRLTTLAAVTMCPIDSPYLEISDVVSYNHYFGWYGGETDMNGPWFDKFHALHPTLPIGVSEYGCEALNWHTSDPRQGDYTEEYQAYYHEELIKQLFTRKYLWATHVWNMFDFGADARSEGGENGQNHKGLVTFDRSYKKDAFYAYKAWLSDEPFVHICGKRYTERVEPLTRVTVYSNQPEVELFANGKSLGKKTSEVHFFYFEVPNEGETELLAVAGECRDESRLTKVDAFPEKYRLVEKNAVLNWFEVDMPEGRLSLNDKMGDVLATLRGKLLFLGLAKKMMGGKKKGEKKEAMGFELTGDLMQMMKGFTVLRLLGMMGMMNVSFTKEELLKINKKLNRIKKKQKKEE